MLQLSQSQLEQRVSECDLENWSFEDRIESMAYASNTLSGILTLLEASEEPKTGYGIFQDILENCFGFHCREDWGDMSRYYGAVTFQARTFPMFSLLSEERTLKQGPYGSREITVFAKTPRGFIFGDPIAARCLSASYNIDISPIRIFTAASKKGATRAPTTSVKILSLLEIIEDATEREILTYCFWDPNNREEYSILKTRVNKNLYRLVENDLIELERVPHLYQYNNLKEIKPEEVPSWVSSDGWRRQKATRIITGLLYEHKEEKFTVTDVVKRTKSDRPTTTQVLKYLSELEFCTYEGERGKNTKIKLTEFGRVISFQVATPILRAASRNFSWQNYRPLRNEEEYQRYWKSYPPIDRDYVLGNLSRDLRRLSDRDLYMISCHHLMDTDRKQNPWRK